MPSGSQVAISSSMPTISLDGSAAGAGGSSLVNGAPDTIAGDYAELIAAGSDFFQASGAKIFNIDAGTIATAYVGQVGRVIQGVTITADMVQRNQQLLNAIGIYCRANGISINVEAQLTNAPSKDWTYQWLGPAVTAGLPVTAVENDSEVEVSSPFKDDLAASAQNMAAIVKQIVQYYPTVSIGQWEGQASLAVTSDWWSDYNLAAKVAGLPSLSYVVADTSWNAPWVTSPTSWQSWLTGLSALVQSNGMQLKVLLDGINTDASDQQWTAQSEQHAAMLAALSGVTVNTLLIRTWQHALPDAILPINQPTTIGNDAAEIAALYPLYQTHSITAQAAAALTALPQVIVTSASTTAIQSPSLVLGAADIAVGARVAVVLIDETGLLSAAAQGSGMVLGAGTNELILNGTSAEVMAELKTLTLTETADGPDSIDIEAFGANGRLADAQIAILALSAGQGTQLQSLNFLPQVAIQPWISSSATVGSNDLITSETFVWNSVIQNAATGDYQLIKTDSIHEPLATLGVSIVNGIAQQSMANDGSLPIGLSAFNPSAFDPASQLSTINVSNTTMTYGQRGQLQTITDTLVPTKPTANIMGGALPNYFITGGSQVTQFNTGDNPNWQSSWGNQFESVTTSYGSNRQILEQMFLGGPNNYYRVLDNVFNPYTGVLWEQYQTSPPPGPNGAFGTGNEYVTEFNTGDNPDWDYQHWGNNAQVTVTWQDYYASAVTTSPSASTPAAAILPPPGSSTIIQDSDVIIVCAGVDTLTVTGSSDTVFGGAGKATISGATSTNLVFVNLGGLHTLFAGAGTPTVFGSFGSTVGSDVIVGGSGALLVATGESNDTIFAGTAAGQTIFGGYSDSGNGSNVIHGGTEDLEIAAGGSNDTIFSGAGNDSIYIGNGKISGNQLINGGTGGLRVQFVGGAGAATITGGSGAATVFGTADSNVKWIGVQTGGILDAVGNVASTGSYDASTSTTNDTLIGASGNVGMMGGSGSDFLLGGVNTGSIGGAGSVVGGTTMTGGAGNNVFLFTSGLVNGGDIVQDFGATDTLALSGYGTAEGANALARATTAGTNTTLTLSDGTSISFVNTSIAQLQGHISST
jgi:Ca2+-binding RTX toxin-like protein